MRVLQIGFGKTGQEIANHIWHDDTLQLVGLVNQSGHLPKSGWVVEAQENGLLTGDRKALRRIIEESNPDVILDISSPDGFMQHLDLLCSYRIPIVLTTTGFTLDQIEKIRSQVYIYSNGLVFAPNITLGVNFMMKATKLAARMMQGFDFHFREIHHAQKKDGPSGTAIKLRDAAFAIAAQSDASDIQFIRSGDVVGYHELLILGEAERIIISHESLNRKAFFYGIKRAMQFIHDKSGYHLMEELF